MRPYIKAILSLADSDLSYAITERITDSQRFTTVTEDEPSDIIPVALSLLCLEEDWSEEDPLLVTHICLLIKQQRVATNQIRIKGIDVVTLPKLLVSQLLNALPANFRNRAKKYFQHGYNKIPDKTGEALLKALLKLCPNEKREIAELIAKLENRGIKWRDQRSINRAYEKDAVALALDIFGADRSEILGNWRTENGSIGSTFLAGLTEYQAYEDDFINHDLRNLPGWQQISEFMAGIVEFENDDNEKLTIINANRKPLEKALGVDLIYFHRKYEAFIMVQYKMMNRGYERESKGIYYNPKERSQIQELKRMQEIFKLLQKDEKSVRLEEFRLSECPFFFKLCKRNQFKATDHAIIPGAYIPLTQWNMLLKHKSTIGPNGGRQIGYHTLGKRYIGTKTFVDLMQRGFIGTQLLGSKRIAKYIESILEQKHSVIYAIDSRKHEKQVRDDTDAEL